jgi:S-adenosylmethionine uptake transporter
MGGMSDNLRGAVLMTVGMACFIVNDAFVKAALTHLPLFQALFLRGLMATAALVVIARSLGALRLRPPRRDAARIGLRTGAEIAAAVFYLTALTQLPLANATAILQALPLTVTLAGALFLGEAVGWRRMLAILVGFGGVLLIVRPGAEGFTIYSVYALIGVAAVTVRDLATRRMSAATPSLTVAAFGARGVTLFAGGASTTEAWLPVTPVAAAQLVGSALALIGGYFCSVAAMRTGDIAVVTPFRYTGLVWALILGLLVFGDWPDAMTLTGAAIVVATGLFTLHRERQLARRSVTRDAGAAPDGAAVDTPRDSH